MCLGYWGDSTPGWLSSEPGKLSVYLSVWGRALGGERVSWGEANPPHPPARCVGRPAQSSAKPAPERGLAASSLWLERGVVSPFSSRVRQSSFRHREGIKALPRPRGATGRPRKGSKPALGACPAMQRASSQYSSWKPWLVLFLQKPTQESKVISARMGTSQSNQEIPRG